MYYYNEVLHNNLCDTTTIKKNYFIYLHIHITILSIFK